MKYMLMIYTNASAAQAVSENIDQAMATVEDLMAELTAAGEWVGGEALADPAGSRTITLKNGVPAVTDGPFLESKEYLAGYCVIDCASPERALEVAMRWPDVAYGGAIELRPVFEE
ncbi:MULTISPECIES: YciI family protein [Nonomuraea]|uniref:YciI family protein n=1 Tax=Nonomuraea mangrovi TaxID=2316207 RepID=A0ABW4T2L1_9ACTN